MPIYQYQCTDCGHELEALQKFSEAPLTDCPACGKASLRKQLTAAAFHLKGTGWYVTDFRDQGKKGDTGKKDPDKKESAATGTDTKPSASDAKPAAAGASTAATTTTTPDK
jgi:putative FmdB family regulatory protein